MSIVIALGDLHGKTGVISRLKHLKTKYPAALTVFIGDYIDSFGENHGFELLEQIQAIQLADPNHTIVLMGNHEQAAVDFFEDESQDAWLSFGGDNTLWTATINLGGVDENVAQERRFILERKRNLISWMSQLPLNYSQDKLYFVHAGLDLSLNDPISETSNHDRLLLRGKYWYSCNDWGTFAQNKLGMSIVTGHTANGMIMGSYDEKLVQRPDKCESEHSPIYAIQYPGEMPRYLMDGGAGEGDSRVLGNIGVFDSETGLLIDAVED